MRSEITKLTLAGLALAALPRAAAAQQPAPPPFAGFNSTRCVIAARVIDGIVRRSATDTAASKPGTDTLFTASNDSIKVCQAAFGGTTDDPTETLNLARVQLYTRQDAAAMATARKHLGTMTKRTPGERAWELYLVTSDNLAGRPARLAPAKETIAELDKLGTPAASVRVLAHLGMASAAWSRYDDATVRTETSAAIAAWKELDTETRLWRADALVNAFLMRAHLAALTAGGDAARAVIDTARGVVPPNAPSRFYIENAGRMYKSVGKPATRLEAAYWYNTGDAGKARPSRGKVAIIISPLRPCTFWCPSMVRAMKRFDKRYRDRGLELTFHTATTGFYADTAPATPFDEARYDSTYFLGEVNLPGAVAIAETEYSWKPDGRRVNTPTANQVNYPAATVVFVDRKGIIRYVASGWQAALENRYAQYIEKLLAEDAGGP